MSAWEEAGQLGFVRDCVRLMFYIARVGESANDILGRDICGRGWGHKNILALMEPATSARIQQDLAYVYWMCEMDEFVGTQEEFREKLRARLQRMIVSARRILDYDIALGSVESVLHPRLVEEMKSLLQSAKRWCER